MMDDFYWRNARDSLLTPAALSIFQILSTYDNQDFDKIKNEVDEKYVQATGKTGGISKNGGYIQTWVRAVQEAGWVFFASEEEAKIIKITEAGKQALLLLSELPDFLKSAPAFVIELLSRYQLNNPAKPKTSKNSEYEEKLATSNIFPYWTLFKILRAVDNYIKSEELKRFVFKIHSQDKIDHCIESIINFRKDISSGMSSEELNKKYPPPLEGAVGEPKYIMGRLGTQVGATPPVLIKEGQNEWRLTEHYAPFIDRIIKDEPTYKIYESEIDWMAIHGEAINTIAEETPGYIPNSPETLESLISDDDPIYLSVKELIESGSLNIILTGPPGTSKTWYARQIAAKVLDGDSGRLFNIQFHPSYSYEDFVEGYIPFEKDNITGFKLESKTFKNACDQARNNKDLIHIVQIDEFSRGDPSRIFGELLTYIESDYREIPFILPYSQLKYSIPKNLIIIGTMNPYDKSVSDLDDAMERRFDRIEMNPDKNIVSMFLNESNLTEAQKGKVIHFFDKVNGVSKHGFGHVYFSKISTVEDLKRLWKYKLSFFFKKMFKFENETYLQVNSWFDEILEIDGAENKSELDTTKG
jgi:hypothetical protein